MGKALLRHKSGNVLETGESGSRGQEYQDDECERIDQLFSAYSEIVFASRSLQAVKEAVQAATGKVSRTDAGGDKQGDSGREGWGGYSYDIAEYKRLAVEDSFQRLREAESELQVRSACGLVFMFVCLFVGLIRPNLRSLYVRYERLS